MDKRKISIMTAARLLFLAALLVPHIACPATAEPTGPLEQVRQTVEQVLTLLRDPPPSPEARRQALTSTIRSRFDFQVMAQGTLAQNWKTATVEQRQRFSALFADLLEASYLGRIEAYTDERVEYAGEKTLGKRGIVDTVIVTSSSEIPIRYKLILNRDRWLVYDVVIEEVSLVRNYRSTYGEIIRTEGMEELLAKMEDKLKDLQSAREVNDALQR
ncbi:MAG: toluene tolerance protein [Desulfuromonas sp.]|uniref:MlaC/ttg2D family ABC transporter substrate-binding protein n=1 Tax=Desulfuromonas sp. TaxID=892 RepID=UPI000CBE534E|nr:ABC transporter substrate-binding protein [Desulfuromonas sp.]PLX86536.1 MAG: toluene tolerance protein [Desulfuromonas sp.]